MEQAHTEQKPDAVARFAQRAGFPTAAQQIAQDKSRIVLEAMAAVEEVTGRPLSQSPARARLARARRARGWPEPGARAAGQSPRNRPGGQAPALRGN